MLFFKLLCRSSMISETQILKFFYLIQGYLLEKVALNLREAYLSMKVEDQIQTSQKLVLMLSAIVASPNSLDGIYIYQKYFPLSSCELIDYFNS